MTVGIRGPRTTRASRIAGLGVLVVAIAIATAACGDPGSGTPRPTDPRAILIDGVTATAALPSLRLHVEISATSAGLGGPGVQGVLTMTIDADVDLATRQLAGRTTEHFATGPGDNAGNAGFPINQTSDMIVTTTASFTKDSTTGRWQKMPTTGGVAGPTNAQITALITTLLADPTTTFDLDEAASCTLGTCDHVIAHIDGPTLALAIRPMTGMPADAPNVAVPDLDVDVLVDQATSVISDLRTQIAMGGQTEQILVTLSNPGQPVQIVAPPAAITDDFGVNFGGGPGGLVPAPSIILQTVGDGVETPFPTDLEVESSAP